MQLEVNDVKVRTNIIYLTTAERHLPLHYTGMSLGFVIALHPSVLCHHITYSRVSSVVTMIALQRRLSWLAQFYGLSSPADRALCLARSVVRSG